MPFNINDFIQNTQGGFAREAHFEAILQLPKSLANGSVAPNGIADAATNPQSNRNNINSLRDPDATNSVSQIRQLSLLCSGAQLPGRSISTTTVNRFGQGFTQQFAVGTRYEEFSLDFYCDAKASNLKLLHTWMDSIFSFDIDTYQQVEYSDNYTAPMSLLQYDTQGKQIAEWKFEEIFPVSLPPINFSWAARGSFIVVQAVFGFARYEQLKSPKTFTAVSDTFKKAASNRLDARSVIPL